MTMKLTNTGKRIRCRLGRTCDELQFTRSIWQDENGVEYIKHKAFINGIIELDLLYPHMLDYSIE